MRITISDDAPEPTEGTATVHVLSGVVGYLFRH